MRDPYKSEWHHILAWEASCPVHCPEKTLYGKRREWRGKRPKSVIVALSRTAEAEQQYRKGETRQEENTDQRCAEYEELNKTNHKPKEPLDPAAQTGAILWARASHITAQGKETGRKLGVFQGIQCTCPKLSPRNMYRNGPRRLHFAATDSEEDRQKKTRAHQRWEKLQLSYRKADDEYHRERHNFVWVQDCKYTGEWYRMRARGFLSPALSVSKAQR